MWWIPIGQIKKCPSSTRFPLTQPKRSLWWRLHQQRRRRRKRRRRRRRLQQRRRRAAVPKPAATQRPVSHCVQRAPWRDNHTAICWTRASTRRALTHCSIPVRRRRRRGPIDHSVLWPLPWPQWSRAVSTRSIQWRPAPRPPTPAASVMWRPVSRARLPWTPPPTRPPQDPTPLKVQWCVCSTASTVNIVPKNERKKRGKKSEAVVLLDDLKKMMQRKIYFLIYDFIISINTTIILIRYVFLVKETSLQTQYGISPKKNSGFNHLRN